MPITPRVRQLIDTAEFRRLGRISQLGLVALVYPAAHPHAVRTLAGRVPAGPVVSPATVPRRTIRRGDSPEGCRAADCGRPAARPGTLAILPSDRRHELAGRAAARTVCEQLLCWKVKSPTRCGTTGASLRARSSRCCRKSRGTPSRGCLSSMLSGPIDVDKMDYLMRDSLHAGVPYGRNFDQQRLIGSLCVNEAGDGLAITDKGARRPR